MKTLSTLLLCLLLTACNTLRPADPGLFTGLELQTGVQGNGKVFVTTVTYDTYTKLWDACEQQGVLGCAKHSITKQSCLRKLKDPEKCKVIQAPFEYCVILLHKQTSYAVWGHELRHCYEGNFHD